MAKAGAAGSAIGWYGPLIDLSNAASHVGDFVQLLVLVHPSTSIQHKLSKGGEVARTDIQVGDDTRPFFSVVLWGKQMSSIVSPGDLILLQNVKITRFGSIVEARSIYCSSISCVVHPYDSIFSKGVNELVESCRGGIAVKQKLMKVVEWVRQHYGSTIPRNLQNPQTKPSVRNWKVQEEQILCKCSTLSELLHLNAPGKASITASVSEVFLPGMQHGFNQERVFLTKKINDRNENVVEDIISMGCRLCGSLLTSESTEKKASSYYCEKSSNHFHLMGMIYRPFMLYVWDDSNHMPLFVKNKAAELLFGNITAEKVYQSYHCQRLFQAGGKSFETNTNHHHHKVLGDEATWLSPPLENKAARSEEELQNKRYRSASIFLVWLVLLRMLVIQGKNSPLRFEVLVNPSLELQDGRFEMISMSMPCTISN